MADDNCATRRKESTFEIAACLLGGIAALRCDIADGIQAHQLICDGLPVAALTNLLDQLCRVSKRRSLRVAGLSERTYARYRSRPDRRLSRHQGGQVWVIAETLALAMQGLPSQWQAEQWLEAPNSLLDGMCALDLLLTPPGTRLVQSALVGLRDSCLARIDFAHS